MTLDWENIEQVQKVIKNSEWLRDELQISKEQLTLLTEMTGYIEFMLIGKFVFGVREILWKIKMDKGDTYVHTNVNTMKIHMKDFDGGICVGEYAKDIDMEIVGYNEDIEKELKYMNLCEYDIEDTSISYLY